MESGDLGGGGTVYEVTSEASRITTSWIPKHACGQGVHLLNAVKRVI